MDDPNGLPSPASSPRPQPIPQPTSTDQQASTTQDTNPPHPRTSLTDPGDTPRPRDARTIHLILATLGVNAYQERVPLQLLDFAYRYTAGVLSDAQHLAAEGYVNHPSSSSGGAGAGGGGGKEAKQQKDGDVSVSALRLATSARLGYTFNAASLPKETMLEMAAERNRIRLPAVGRQVGFGVRLPHERFLMTGAGWNVPPEWEEVGVEGESEDGGTEEGGEGDAEMGFDGVDERGVHGGDGEGGEDADGRGDDTMGDDAEEKEGAKSQVAGQEDAGDGNGAAKEEDAKMDEG